MFAGKFLEKFLAGNVSADEIDDYIDMWHKGDGAGLGLSEFLGMTREQYEAWVADSNSLEKLKNEKADKI